MKKNKKILPLLVILTLIIWGVIAYQVYLSMGQTSDGVFDVQNSIPVLPADDTIDFQYQLNLDYRDPFLNKRFSIPKPRSQNPVVRSAPARPQAPKRKTPPPRVRNKQQPKIEYKAYIRNVSVARVGASIRINEKGYTVFAGDSVQEVKVLKIYKDSIQVRFDGKPLTIKIQ